MTIAFATIATVIPAHYLMGKYSLLWEELQQEKKLLEALMDAARDSIYFKDEQSRLIRINKKMQQDLNIDDLSQVIGKTDNELFGKELFQQTRAEEQQIIETGKPLIDYDEELQKPDGQSNWTSTTKVPMRDPLGKITGIIGITREINERKNAEIALQEAHDQLELRVEERTTDLIKTNEKLQGEIAERAELALENARLFTEANQRLDRLSSLRSIDQTISSSLDLNFTLNILLKQVLTQLAVDAAAVLLFDRHLQTLEFIVGQGFRTKALHYTNLRLGEGLAGKAALERKIVQLQDLGDQETAFAQSSLLKNEGFVTYYGIPLIAKGKILGVLEIFHRQKHSAEPEWLEFLETLAGQAAIAIDNISLFNDMQRSNIELVQAYDDTIEGWARGLELRDLETEGHCRRVVDLTLKLARNFDISKDEMVHIRRGALLHDIGKIGVPDSILSKPGPLNADEWQVMKKHPVYAYEWLLPIHYLRPALEIPYCHHEKWDGTGYPRGLTGEQIPLSGRIFAIVDVWDALKSDRPYRDAWPLEKILEFIHSEAGKHFDPQVVKAFLALHRELALE
ncbi:MAG: GAF domain-containing protein [Anaerolineales bacterium]|nr:GAF domain-containing protein [Chloroflexota bacterium]MBL6980638.1 GAF domain-containing protein [Anaerolineales bacterium]